MDSLPTASTPHDADDAEVGSQEGTHQEERAPEMSQDNLPDFAPDSAPEPIVAPESGVLTSLLSLGRVAAYCLAEKCVSHP